MRPIKHVSTSLSVAEAKRLRFLPPRACDFPPGIPTVAQVQSCSTQTCSSDHLTQIHSVSEEGPSHLPEDGWAETQKQVAEIRDFIFGLQDVDSQVCQVEGLQNVDQSVGVQRLVDQQVSDLMMFNDQIIADAEADIELAGNCEIACQQTGVVLESVGTEDSMQNCLDNMLCVHEQDIGSDHKRQHQQQYRQQHKQQSDTCNHEPPAPASAATAIASDDGTVDVGVGGVSMSNTSQQRKRQLQRESPAPAKQAMKAMK